MFLSLFGKRLQFFRIAKLLDPGSFGVVNQTKEGKEGAYLAGLWFRDLAKNI